MICGFVNGYKKFMLLLRFVKICVRLDSLNLLLRANCVSFISVYGKF